MSEVSGEIARAVCRVMAALESLPKDGHNAFSNYEFTTEAMIANTLRPMMAKEGLALIPFNTEITNSEQLGDKMRRVTIAGRFRLVHASGGSINVEVPGEGMDSLDKSTAKALTQSYKYALLQIFCAGRGDDGDTGKGYETPKTSENAAVRSAAQADEAEAASHKRPTYIFTFGKHKDEPITSVPNDYLDWLLKNTEEQIKDPAKARFREKNNVLLNAILSEKYRRAENGQEADEETPF